MLSPEDRFERDRKHFLWLLDLLLDRLQKAGEVPPSFPLIRGILREIDDLEMSERCGLVAPPFAFGEHVDEDGWAGTYEWLDPFQTSPVHTIVRTDDGGGDEDCPGTNEVEARASLSVAVELWIRTVRSMLVPPAFSLLSGSAVPGKDPALARDRLWLQLWQGAWIYRRGGASPRSDWACEHDPRFAAYMRKVNALVRYDGLTTESIFRPSRHVVGVGRPNWLHVMDPRDGTLVQIDFMAGDAPSTDGCVQLGDLITLWKAAREAQLLPRDGKTPIESIRHAGVGDHAHTGYESASSVPTLYDLLKREGDSERLNKLKPCWRCALKGFALACGKDLTLVRTHADGTHHRWLLKNAPSELSGAGGRNEASWLTYVRQGKARLFGKDRDKSPVRTRSIVSPAEADFRKRGD